MPVVLTDFTNKTWCVEQPTDDYLHVGWVGKGGPRLIDVLEFIQTKQDQFDRFIQKKREEELGVKKNVRRRKSNAEYSLISEGGGTNSVGDK